MTPETPTYRVLAYTPAQNLHRYDSRKFASLWGVVDRVQAESPSQAIGQVRLRGTVKPNVPLVAEQEGRAAQ